MIDGDRQGSSLLWFTVARAHGSQLTGVCVEKVEGNDRIAERVKSASGFIAVIVEVAGYAEATLALEAVACDLVVIPTQPHSLDCYQVVQIVKYLRDMEQGGSPVRHKVVLNRMTAMTRNSVAAKAALDVLRNADVERRRHACGNAPSSRRSCTCRARSLRTAPGSGRIGRTRAKQSSRGRR